MGETKKDNNTQVQDSKRMVRTTILAVLIALGCVTAATFAWFSIADNTKLKGMGMDVTSGKSLRFDLDEHENYAEYKQSLGYEDILGRILEDTGVDFHTKALEPVTTDDCIHFYYEKGEPVSPLQGDYMEYILHFCADHDMNVHLTSKSGKDADDKGTLIESDNPQLEQAMRIAFVSDEGTCIYDQTLGKESEIVKDIKYFSIPIGSEIVYNEQNMLFTLKAGVDKPVRVLIWIEGTDEACDNELKGTDYSIRMRFEGTDENFEPFARKQ